MARKAQRIEQLTTPQSSALPVDFVRRPAVISILLALVALVLFLTVLNHKFVNYDDGDYVTANSHVQTGLSWSNLVWAFKTGHASNWHPLTWLSHMLDWQLFGNQPGIHHLVSVLWHMADTVLLFNVFRLMTGALWRSALLALLFAIHPLHVESVAWISERKDVLSTFFFFLTLLSYHCYAKRKSAPSDGSVGRSYALALGFFALGLLSKPMLVTLPFVLLLLDFWPLDRWPGDGSGTLLTLVIEKLPFFALSLISSVITFLVQREGGAVSTTISFTARLANAMVSYARYLGKTFWPVDLSVLYPHPGSWPAWMVIGSATLLLALTGAAIFLARKRPYFTTGWFWFLGMLVPVIGLVQVGIQSMADRYSYVPVIGVFIILVWGGTELVMARPVLRDVVNVALVFTLLGCAWLTHAQVQYWTNSETLFRRAVDVTRDNYLAYNNLGFYLSSQGRVAEAMTNYAKSLQINPNYEDALNNMGYALANQKKHAEAIPYYEAALRVRPGHVEVHNNLGNALSEVGRLDEAIAHYDFVLKVKPDHADAHNNLGIALAMKGRLDEAIPHFKAAIQARSSYASAHSNLGNALAVQHKFQEAIAEYQESLRLKSDDAQAHNNLGNALAELGRVREAIPEYEKALKLNADNPEAHFNLGTALLREGKRDEARTHYAEALRLKPDYEQARRQLQSMP
jgi:tetratricopeptide (TPR) repeat protein